MLVDSREIPENTDIAADICIVGGGVAGMALALEFIGQGFQVSLLESGGLQPDAGSQSLASGENVGLPYFPLDDARPRCFGGSAYNWLVPIGGDHIGIQTRPLDPIDFEERPWVPYSGWPFNRDHLDPYYCRAQSICGLGPYVYETDSWADDTLRPRLPFQGSDVETVMFQLASKAAFLNEQRKKIIESENVTCYLYATVVEVETDESGSLVSRLRVKTPDGRDFSASPRICVLALGAIETARLLLLSRQKHQTGLGNDRDLVGRFFMEHPHLLSGTYYTSPRHEPETMGLYSFHRTDKGRAYGRLALSEETIRRERLLNWSVSVTHKFWPLSVRTGLRKIGSLSKDLGGSLIRGDFEACGQYARTLAPFVINEMTPTVVRSMSRRARKLFVERLKLVRSGTPLVLEHMSEQAPNPSSRVTLSESVDRFGQQRAKLDWQLSPIDLESMQRSQEILDQSLRASGLGRVELEMKGGEVPAGLHGGWHHMGTTRMHIDPTKGVVNENCRIHDVANLYVAGPSTFPTGGYANPVLTIVALAVRLADHLKSLFAAK